MAVSKKLIKEIKEHVSIVDLANEYFQVTSKNRYLGISGDAPDGGDFSSLVIYPDTNSFFRMSTRRGGDVISFVQETGIENINTFKEAVDFLRGRIDPEFKVELKKIKKKKYGDMSMDEKAEKMRKCHESLKEQLVIDSTYRNVMAYLIQERKIDPGIVREGIKKGEIAQIIMNGYRSVAFISKEMGLYSCVSRRSINSRSSFKGDLEGCNYDLGWRIFPNDAKTAGIRPDARIYCFEGYIDMLSYKTFAKMQNKDISKDIFVVCGSVYKYDCVINTAKEFERDVVICFDNDQKGIEMGDVLADHLINVIKGDGLPIKVDKEFSKSKDWNEDLKQLSVNHMKFEKKTDRQMGR